MALQGKGFFIENLSECEGGEPGPILAAAQAAGLSHVVVKIADGTIPTGVNAAGVDFTAPVVETLHAAGIAVWGWHYIYGDNPGAEAALAITRTQALGLDGYVVSAGVEYERPGKSSGARQFIATIHSALKVSVALSSYRFPYYHPKFPWSDFLSLCDLHMPLVFWEQVHDASEQLIESKRQCDSLPNARPYIPTGAAYSAPGWNPTAQDIIDFLDTAQALSLPAVNFFKWDTCQINLPLTWQAIASFPWPASSQSIPAMRSLTTTASKTSAIPTDAFLLRFLAALNSRNATQVATLYDLCAIQVWADQVRRSAEAIQAGFASFFNSLPTRTILSIVSAEVEDDLRKFTWKAGASTGETILTVKNGKVVLDYTFIK